MSIRGRDEHDRIIRTGKEARRLHDLVDGKKIPLMSLQEIRPQEVACLSRMVVKRARFQIRLNNRLACTS